MTTAAELDAAPRWELRRPDLVLQEVSRTLPFDRPRALLARVDGEGLTQRVTSCTVLWESPPVDTLDRTRVTEDALGRLGLPPWTPDSDVSLIVGIVVRPGLAVWSWDEQEVHLGLRYGMNGVRGLQAGPLVVTGQGWYDPLDELAGTSPRAVWRPRLTLVADEGP